MIDRFEALKSLCMGDKVGEGLSREVYDWMSPGNIWLRDGEMIYDKPATQHVVKIEKDSDLLYFQNVQEWTTWLAVQGTPMRKWFAPCQAISKCGRFLIQRKVEPIRKNEMPKRVPAFLYDVRQDNMGLLDGRLVCCDYGFGVWSIKTADRRLVKPKVF